MSALPLHAGLLAAFWGSAALVAFTFAGYPLLVWLQARLWPEHEVPDFDAHDPDAPLPAVSVVLCVHDAADAVVAKLRDLARLDYPRERVEILIACDGCSDGTADACRGMDDGHLRLLEFPQRRGKAACLVDAVAAASGEVLLLVDVRQRIEPAALRRLVARLSDPAIGAVSGALCFESPDGGFGRSVDAYWRYEKLIREAESRSGSTIGVTGALYAMRRELFQPIPAGTVLDDVLLPMQVLARGRRVVFEPGAVAWDRASGSVGQERRRKVRTLAGNLQLLALAPWLLDPRRNPAWFRFVSHKLLRLVAPWALLLLLAATVLLARGGGFYLACLLAAALAALLLALKAALPALSRFWPVRLLDAFFHMNLYSAQAVLAFARGRRLHLW